MHVDVLHRRESERRCIGRHCSNIAARQIEIDLRRHLHLTATMQSKHLIHRGERAAHIERSDDLTLIQDDGAFGHSSKSVTAPREALLTLFAYFASTPRRA